MPWRFWRMTDAVLIVGYSPKLIGGVTKVVNLLCENISYLKLHVALCYHRPKWKSRVFAIYSLLVFGARITFAPPRVLQVVVESPGDVARTLPYILLGRARGCNVCLYFHSNMPAILDGFSSPIRRLILSVWRLAGCYCFLSNRLRDEFPIPSDSRKLYVVIPNPISKQWFHQDIRPRSDRTRDLTFLGRWTTEKGIYDLLTVMRTLDIASPVRCDIYSDIYPRENPRNCFCHDWLGEDEVRQVLRESKLLLLPSHAAIHLRSLRIAIRHNRRHRRSSPTAADTTSQKRTGGGFPSRRWERPPSPEGTAARR